MAHAGGHRLGVNYITQKRMPPALPPPAVPPPALGQSRPKRGAFPVASGRDFRSRRRRTSVRELVLVGRRPRGLERCTGAASLGLDGEGERGARDYLRTLSEP